MIKKAVSSSNLKSVGYDKNNKILEIEFRKGRTYQYFSVPEIIHAELMNAASLGKYHDKMIKNKFEYTRVS